MVLAVKSMIDSFSVGHSIFLKSHSDIQLAEYSTVHLSLSALVG